VALRYFVPIASIRRNSSGVWRFTWAKAFDAAASVSTATNAICLIAIKRCGL
jgi:hypothetical protein